jgi:hypothetical protein
MPHPQEGAGLRVLDVCSVSAAHRVSFGNFGRFNDQASLKFIDKSASTLPGF